MISEENKSRTTNKLFYSESVRNCCNVSTIWNSVFIIFNSLSATISNNGYSLPVSWILFPAKRTKSKCVWRIRWAMHDMSVARMLPDWGKSRQNETSGKFTTLFAMQYGRVVRITIDTRLCGGKRFPTCTHFSVEIIDKCCVRRNRERSSSIEFSVFSSRFDVYWITSRSHASLTFHWTFVVHLLN